MSQITEKMESSIPKIEKLAKLGIGVQGLKEKLGTVTASSDQHTEVLASLKTNLEKNKAILEKNLTSFEDRLKKLGL